MSHCPQPKTCPGCGAAVPHLTGRHRRSYCSKRCSDLVSQRRVLARAKAAGADPLRLVRAIREETPPGVCCYCDGPLPPYVPGRGRRRFMCGALECRRLYERDYAAGRRSPPETLGGDA